MPERFALYYAPAPAAPLSLRAAEWLLRDPAGGPVAEAEIGGLAPDARRAITASARRYGFHATIKAPMRLAAGTTRAGLEAALADFTARSEPVAIGRLQLSFIDGFLALVPETRSEELIALAASVVEAFEPFRAPLEPADRDRRVAAGRLGPHEIALLDRFGYPYVMDAFQFHMTLTDRLPPAERSAVMAAATDWFAEAIAAPFVLDRLSLYHEPSPGAPFRRIADCLLTGVTIDV